MSETATYELLVDWNGDGDFLDTGEDITADFVSGTINRGYDSPLARMPFVGRATFIVNNLDGDYSPPAQANVLPRRQVKFSMTYSGTTTVLFRGFLEEIVPQFGQYSRRAATLECVDAMALLDVYEGDIALLTDTSADEIIEDVVEAVYTPPATSYQSGKNAFPTSAEWWAKGPIGAGGDPTEISTASRKILQAATSDWGRFFIAADGTPTFYNRHQMPLDSSTELTLDDTMLAMAYRKAADSVYNYVEVTCSPRAVGETNEVLGRISQRDAPRIEASDSRLFVVQFRDPVTRDRVGGKDPVTPVAGTDVTATDDPDGEGDSENASLGISATFYGDRAEVTVTNSAAHPIFIQKLQVRGLAVRSRERVTMVASDATSIAAYEKRKLRIDAPLISHPADAQLLADYLLDYYKDPDDQVRGLRIMANKNATWMAAVRDLELMDRVSVTETQTGLSSYIGHIYRLQHDIRSRWEHYLSFDLETAYTLPGTPFRIDTSALNSGHVLIY